MINEQIRDKEVRLIGEDGEQLGIMSAKEALQLAKEAELLPDTIIYMDYGSEEGDFRPQVIQKFSRILSTLMDRGVMASGRIVPGGTHCEASWEKQLPFFMNTLMYGYQEN